jgi:hypothetical protein
VNDKCITPLRDGEIQLNPRNGHSDVRNNGNQCIGHPGIDWCETCGAVFRSEEWNRGCVPAVTTAPKETSELLDDMTELSAIINTARERACTEHGPEIKWLLELPMTDDELKRFDKLTSWARRK